MKTNSVAKMVAVGFAAMILVSAGAVRAEEGTDVAYTGNNEAQADAAEMGNPHSVLNRVQYQKVDAATATAQVDDAEAGNPHSVKNAQPVRVATRTPVNQAQVRAAEAGNPHSTDNR